MKHNLRFGLVLGRLAILKKYKVVSTNARYYLENQLFVKRTQYIRVENLLHKQSGISYMCFNTRRLELATIRYIYLVNIYYR